MEFKIQIAARQGQQTCANAQIDFRNDEKELKSSKEVNASAAYGRLLFSFHLRVLTTQSAAIFSTPI